MLGIFANFSAPRKTPKNDYLYVGVSRWFFKNSHFRENELNPPSPVRPLLDVFYVSQVPGGAGVTHGRTHARTRAVTTETETTPPPRAGTKPSRSGERTPLRSRPPPPSLQHMQKMKSE